MEEAGIPTMHGSDHIGITVPDIEAATDFIVNVLGGEVLFELGPISHEDDFMIHHMSIHPRSVIQKLRMIKVKNGPALELFQYQAPDQHLDHPRNTDAGGHHVGFYVDDMDAAIDYLESRGVKVQGSPTYIPTGPSEGLTWCYFLAPWGLQMELVSYPKGLAYEKRSKSKMWSPRP